MSEFGPWSVRSLRLTVFPEPSAEKARRLDSGELFYQLSGEQCVTFTRNPRESTEIAFGPIGGNGVSIELDPHRVQWKFDPLDDGTGIRPEPALLSSPAGAIDSLRITLLNFAADFPLRRIAIGALLAQHTSDNDESYGRLANILPRLNLVPGQTSDLIYRINRPRDSKCQEGLKLNKLATWSAAVFRAFQVVGDARQTGNFGMVAESYEIRLEFDVNTSGERTESIPVENIECIFNELMQIATDLATNGDV